MYWVIACLAVLGIAIDIWFIKTEYAGKMVKATVYKGLASLTFVSLGIYAYIRVPSRFGLLIVIGLILGLIGDVLLNLRNVLRGAASRKIFALGIFSFVCGHFLYIAALIGRNTDIILISLIVTAVASAVLIRPLMTRITAPSKGLEIFGYVYLAIVIGMSSCAEVLLYKEVSPLTILFFFGGLLFMVSDFIMIYYSFGKKIKPLRAINLLAYFVGQVLIATSILFA
jgi:uncharacterized membrane protein YhhN